MYRLLQKRLKCYPHVNVWRIWIPTTGNLIQLNNLENAIDAKMPLLTNIHWCRFFLISSSFKTKNHNNIRKENGVIMDRQKEMLNGCGVTHKKTISEAITITGTASVDDLRQKAYSVKEIEEIRFLSHSNLASYV